MENTVTQIDWKPSAILCRVRTKECRVTTKHGDTLALHVPVGEVPQDKLLALLESHFPNGNFKAAEPISIETTEAYW